MEYIKIFDTTLRDGEQSPGASMNTEEKIKIALQLEKLGVDIIEAGFAAASPGDFEAIKEISAHIQNATICSLSRALPSDIEKSAQALEKAKHKMIHTFIATSPIHMEYKLKMSPDKVLQKATEAVKLSKSFCDNVEFSCEDASRSDMGFLKEIIDECIKAGASTINIPDTVGYRLPNEMGDLIKELKQSVIKDRAIISVHCHNDLGLAVANSIFALYNGARQIECTINGLGERAGNAALEELVMAIKTRKDIFQSMATKINTKEIYKTSILVGSLTGIKPQPNKAIVGKNAFAHESGIHQDGMLKHKDTYEIMKPEDIGIQSNSLILGKHSGRHAFKDKAKILGFVLNEDELNKSFCKFKNLCDKKKEIYDDDIRAILSEETSHIHKVYELKYLNITSSLAGVPYAAICISKDGKQFQDSAIGEGSIDAIFKTIDRITQNKGNLKDYKVDALSSDKDALAKVVVNVEFDKDKGAVIGHGTHIDTIIASAKAYISALNNYLSMKNLLKKRK